MEPRKTNWAPLSFSTSAGAHFIRKAIRAPSRPHTYSRLVVQILSFGFNNIRYFSVKSYPMVPFRVPQVRKTLRRTIWDRTTLHHCPITEPSHWFEASHSSHDKDFTERPLTFVSHFRPFQVPAARFGFTQEFSPSLSSNGFLTEQGLS